MKVLLDTCSLVWLCSEPDSLSKAATDIIEDADVELHVSPISMWEMMLKHQMGRYDFKRDPEKILEEACDRYGLTWLPFTNTAAYHSLRLPLLHRDPFDRMLVCQALIEGASILTPDKHIERYSVRTIW